MFIWYVSSYIFIILFIYIIYDYFILGIIKDVYFRPFKESLYLLYLW